MRLVFPLAIPVLAGSALYVTAFVTTQPHQLRSARCASTRKKETALHDMEQKDTSLDVLKLLQRERENPNSIAEDEEIRQTDLPITFHRLHREAPTPEMAREHLMDLDRFRGVLVGALMGSAVGKTYLSVKTAQTGKLVAEPGRQGYVTAVIERLMGDESLGELQYGGLGALMLSVGQALSDHGGVLSPDLRSGREADSSIDGWTVGESMSDTYLSSRIRGFAPCHSKLLRAISFPRDAAVRASAARVHLEREKAVMTNRQAQEQAMREEQKKKWEQAEEAISRVMENRAEFQGGTHVVAKLPPWEDKSAEGGKGEEIWPQPIPDMNLPAGINEPFPVLGGAGDEVEEGNEGVSVIGTAGSLEDVSPSSKEKEKTGVLRAFSLLGNGEDPMKLPGGESWSEVRRRDGRVEVWGPVDDLSEGERRQLSQLPSWSSRAVGDGLGAATTAALVGPLSLFFYQPNEKTVKGLEQEPALGRINRGALSRSAHDLAFLAESTPAAVLQAVVGAQAVLGALLAPRSGGKKAAEEIIEGLVQSLDHAEKNLPLVGETADLYREDIETLKKTVRRPSSWWIKRALTKSPDKKMEDYFCDRKMRLEKSIQEGRAEAEGSSRRFSSLTAQMRTDRETSVNTHPNDHLEDEDDLNLEGFSTGSSQDDQKEKEGNEGDRSWLTDLGVDLVRDETAEREDASGIALTALWASLRGVSRGLSFFDVLKAALVPGGASEVVATLAGAVAGGWMGLSGLDLEVMSMEPARRKKAQPAADKVPSVSRPLRVLERTEGVRTAVALADDIFQKTTGLLVDDLLQRAGPTAFTVRMPTAPLPVSDDADNNNSPLMDPRLPRKVGGAVGLGNRPLETPEVYDRKIVERHFKRGTGKGRRRARREDGAEAVEVDEDLVARYLEEGRKRRNSLASLGVGEQGGHSFDREEEGEVRREGIKKQVRSRRRSLKFRPTSANGAFREREDVVGGS
uniref:Uncharacterized protein n=1 Tax=Chromera velia CCMP2878 TaxID=1169474 RepID=A0A0G4HXI0_9ALVE|eukprot:Cvel_1501.t1-p1 / transcript=Cvel_1501.t1 / gene=Cvel_1501 / organism=Chromera_velia_CCMP2878 / gene_product=hypothetical protein / transcript_product=hypothetical protein / location=Cvel_scaffold52:130070-136561(-) / protein_length=966 / sequence_SO=supercontig / SO=protein_coding / is_pseudo=false